MQFNPWLDSNPPRRAHLPTRRAGQPSHAHLAGDVAPVHEFLYTINYNSPLASGVYALINVETGNLYVGSTVNLTDRISHHFRLLEEGLHPNRDLQHSFSTHGASRFSAVVLERCTARYLRDAEQKWLNRLRKRAFNRQMIIMRPEVA